ncbi:hypothetical protein [Caldicellulosiruptor morganii]|uniref:Uncharacterized protein n=1 Tax=Caldicellulosiruptor morganii TaxID=1387555 RepID=A0ABY7BQI5_9FIRM|nr:hypothetical protein [Caldicellulosiruptor morganii]WAM33286.1 hypothetical protein OTK00_001781 [Caldicellulosiruptor morganii]
MGKELLKTAAITIITIAGVVVFGLTKANIYVSLQLLPFRLKIKKKMVR